MLEISIRFLAGHFHATPWERNPREGEPEWPPSPWRLLRSLVASYYRSPQDFTRDDVLSVLRALAVAPEFHLPTATAGHTRQYFPQSQPGKKQLLFDAFVRVDEPVIVRWPQICLSESQLSLLAKLLQGVSYFGRAESWSELEVLGSPATAPTNCRCDLASCSDVDPIRVLGAALEVDWEHLTVQTGELQKLGWSAPPGSRWLNYHRPADCFQPQVQTRPSGYNPVALRFAYLRPVRPRVANTLFASETIRTDFLRLMGHVDGELKAVFAGKITDESGVVHCLQGHRHPYILPCSTSDPPHLLDEVVIYRKGDTLSSFPEQILDVFTRKLGGFQEHIHRLHRLQFLELLDKTHLALLPQFRVATTWDSATPFVQNRHLKGSRETLLGQVRRELAFHTDVEPGNLLRVEVLTSDRIGGVLLSDFRTQRRDRARPLAGVRNLRLHFATPVSGPLSLGYGSHFGLGQFSPSS